MAVQFSFVYSAPPIVLLPSAADAAGRTGAYKSLRNCAGVLSVECEVNQGNAATVQFTLLQAKDSSGTGSKAIPTVPVFLNDDTSVGDALAPTTAGPNYTTDATIKNKIVIFQFDPAELDVSNGFNHLAVQTGASNAANITSARLRYVGTYQQATPPASEV